MEFSILFIWVVVTGENLIVWVVVAEEIFFIWVAVLKIKCLSPPDIFFDGIALSLIVEFLIPSKPLSVRFQYKLVCLKYCSFDLVII